MEIFYFKYLLCTLLLIYVLTELHKVIINKKLKNMKVNTKYEGKDISITLTKTQLDDIAKQINNEITIENLNFDKAIELLIIDDDIDPNPKGLYKGPLLQLITIIKAANFLDNNKQEWIPNWQNSNENKYFPIFTKENSVWSVSDCFYDCISSNAGVEYYKKKETGLFIANKFLDLYSKIL